MSAALDVSDEYRNTQFHHNNIGLLRQFTLEAHLAIHQEENVILELNFGFSAGNVLCYMNND